jgi:hypothetical protein
MNVVIHGDVFARVKRSPAVDVEVIDYSLCHEFGSYSAYF